MVSSCKHPIRSRWAASTVHFSSDWIRDFSFFYLSWWLDCLFPQRWYGPDFCSIPYSLYRGSFIKILQPEDLSLPACRCTGLRASGSTTTDNWPEKETVGTKCLLTLACSKNKSCEMRSSRLDWLVRNFHFLTTTRCEQIQFRSAGGQRIL